MGNHTHIETSQQRADRVLAEYQRARNTYRASRMVLELSVDPAPEPGRWVRLRYAARLICEGSPRPLADAALMAFILFSAAAVTAFIALIAGDPEPPRGRAFEATSATSSPTAASPRDRGALGEAR